MRSYSMYQVNRQVEWKCGWRTRAPSLARSHRSRPDRNLIFVPCLPIGIHFALRNRPRRDQCSTRTSFMRANRTSRETPRKSWPTKTSGSALNKVTREVDVRAVRHPRGTKDLPRRLLRSIRSFCIGDITPFPLTLARFSKLEGNLSRGRTNVCTEQGNCSGGVGSSNCTGD